MENEKLERLAERLAKAEKMAQTKDAVARKKAEEAKKAHERVMALREKYNALLLGKMMNVAKERGVDFGTLTADEIAFLVQSLATRRRAEPAPAQAPATEPALQKADEFAYDPFR